MARVDTTPAEVERLDALDDDEFACVVEAHISSATGDPSVWTALCHPALVGRTAGCLDELAEVLGEDVSRRGLPRAHYATKRLGVVRNRRQQVEAALGRAERAAVHREHMRRQQAVDRELLRQLTLAVDAHRCACIAANLEPEPHDLTLWAALDELRLPAYDPGTTEGPTLAEMLISAIWYNPAAVSA